MPGTGTLWRKAVAAPRLVNPVLTGRDTMARDNDPMALCGETGGASVYADDFPFRGMLYGWMISITGNMTARCKPVDVNAGFLRIVQKSDSGAAFMGNVEAGRGKSASIPISYGRSSASIGRWSPILIEADRAFSMVRSGGMSWIDPVLGLRLRHQFTPSQTVTLRGDVGSFGLGNQFAWQAAATHAYAWQFSSYGLGALGGYSALGVTYVQHSGINMAGIEAVLHGLPNCLTLRF
ncbi:MAG: hypothetical protein WCG92_07510 [Hyphomicrobiales bacterium]